MEKTKADRCDNHQVRNCMVCWPISVGARIDSAPPPIPDFPNEENHFQEETIHIAPNTYKTEPESPLVTAARKCTAACRAHADAQVNVARLKQELVEATAFEDKMWTEKVFAQTEMAKLVEEMK